MTELCLGVCCPIHHECQRYLAVDGAVNAEFIGTCLKDGERPLFIRVSPSKKDLQSVESALQLRYQQME